MAPQFHGSPLQLNMKFLTMLAGLSLVAAKPQFGKDLRLAEGRIIGGEEAPKRNYSPYKPVPYKNYFQTSFPGRFLSSRSGATSVAAPS